MTHLSEPEYCETSLDRIDLTADMRHFTFGRNNGMRVSALALGAGKFGTRWGYGAQPRSRRRSSTGSPTPVEPHRYRGELPFGESEEILVGCWAADATSSAWPPSSRSVVQGPGPLQTGNRRQAMVGSVEASLRRSAPTTSTSLGALSG